MKLWVLVLSLASCVRAQRPFQDPVLQVLQQHAEPGSTQYAAPGPALEAQPWKVGQWTLYKRRFGQALFIETFKVVAQDACGFWIENEVRSSFSRTRWTFCVTQQPAPDSHHLEESLGALIERDNDTVVALGDFRRGEWDRQPFVWLVESVHAPWASHADLPREDVMTPAGRFDGAVKMTSKRGSAEVSQWSHPDVPLGGLIRETSSDDRERVLLDFGTSNDESQLVADAVHATQLQGRLRRRGPVWWSLGLGYDSLGKPEEVNQTTAGSFASGFRQTATVDVIGNVEAIGDASFSADPRLREIFFFAGLGARWMPFGRPRKPDRLLGFSASSLWLQADVGYAELLRGRVDDEPSTVGRGIGLGAKVGFLLMQGRDWTYGLEVHDHVGLFNADEGLRNTFGVRGVFQFFLF
jgi:hypothetical protein